MLREAAAGKRGCLQVSATSAPPARKRPTRSAMELAEQGGESLRGDRVSPPRRRPGPGWTPLAPPQDCSCPPAARWGRKGGRSAGEVRGGEGEVQDFRAASGVYQPAAFGEASRGGAESSRLWVGLSGPGGTELVQGVATVPSSRLPKGGV